MTISDLVALLESAGLKVAPPGDNTTSLPCVVLSPVGLEMQPGGRHLYHVVDVCPTVPLTPRLTRNDEAIALAVDVYRTMAGTQFVYTTAIATYEEDAEHQPPSMFHRIRVRFVGPDLCPEPEP